MTIKTLFTNIFLLTVISVPLFITAFLSGKSSVFAQNTGAIVILNEAVRDTGYGSIIVTWDTNLPAGSRVVYDTVSHEADVKAYQWSTADIKLLSTLHGEIINGLAKGTYYVRPVSKVGNSEFIGKELKVTLNSVLTLASTTPTLPNAYKKAEDFEKILTSPAPALPSCENPLVGYIFMGSESNRPKEVRKLQTFLRDKEGFSDVVESGIYDIQTITAVREFQKRYAGEILAPWGITEPTGHVYKTTRKKINETVCPGGNFAVAPDEMVAMTPPKSAVLGTATTTPVLSTEKTSIAELFKSLENLENAGGVLPVSDAKKESGGEGMMAVSYAKPVFNAIVGPLFATSHQAWPFASTFTVIALFVLGLIAVLVLRRN